MGIIADTFRQMKGVKTGKGLHCVSAWGKDIKKNSKGFSHLINNDGWALLLGVDIYRLTSMHYVESELPIEIINKFKAPKELLEYYPENEWYIEVGSPSIPGDAWEVR